MRLDSNGELPHQSEPLSLFPVEEAEEVLDSVTLAKPADGCEAVDGVEEKSRLHAHLFACSQEPRLGDEVGLDGNGAILVEGVFVDSVAEFCWQVVQRGVVHCWCTEDGGVDGEGRKWKVEVGRL